MWSYFLFRVISRAAECCTYCKRSVKNLGRPYSNELQLSSLEVIKAWTKVSVSVVDKQSLILTMLRKCKKFADTSYMLVENNF